MKSTVKILAAAALLAAGAAHAIQPQNGFWAIDGELNGQPGRGFQIDVQGETLIFSYYGYRSDGSATFYLSSGKYDVNNGQYEGRLFEYKGGTPVGEAFRNGSEAGSPGTFSLKFVDSNKGTLALPGEPVKAISRFSFNDPSSRFNGKVWKGDSFGVGVFYNDQTDFTFALGGGIFNLQQKAFFSGTCLYDGNYVVRGEELEASGKYRCSDFSEGDFSAVRLKVDADGTYTGVIHNVPKDGKPAYTVYHTAR
ncbi:hypothetical protein GCM10027082_30990 [Comamonas humi]